MNIGLSSELWGTPLDKMNLKNCDINMFYVFCAQIPLLLTS